MQFKSAIISVLLAAINVHGFVPSMTNSRRTLATKMSSAFAVSADEVNAKLAAQMEKLKAKDATSPSLGPDVSIFNFFV